MGMDLNSLRMYALGLAHRAVSDISRDNFRQLRNYVDMCAFLARTDAQKDFFTRAQTTLEKTDSLYYPLIQRTINTVSADMLCTVGVNLGVDALTYGASQLKKAAQETDAPVYWLTVANAADAGLPLRVAAGEAAGQFLWVLHSADGECEEAKYLAATHQKSDFVLLLSPDRITPQLAASLAETNNLVPVLQLSSPEIDEVTHNAVVCLRREKVLYGLQVALADETAALATSQEWLGVLAQYTLFCVYTHPGMAEEKAAQLVQEVYRSRSTASTPVLLFSWEEDTATIGNFISPSAQVEYRIHAGQ